MIGDRLVKTNQNLLLLLELTYFHYFLLKLDSFSSAIDTFFPAFVRTFGKGTPDDSMPKHKGHIESNPFGLVFFLL